VTTDDMNDSLDDTDKTMPLTSGEFAPEASHLLAGGETKRRLSSGTIVLVGVVGLAGLGLFGMRQLGTASGAGTVSGEVQKLIDDLVDGKSAQAPTPDRPLSTADELLRPLLINYSEHRVPLENVQKNPFLLYETVVIREEDDDHPPVGPDRAAECKKFKEAVAIAATVFKVKSVMAGGTPNALANINGQIVRVGHMVTDEEKTYPFKVWKIDPENVLLIVENTELECSAEVPLPVHPEM
jgi:hypothetical protein